MAEVFIIQNFSVHVSIQIFFQLWVQRISSAADQHGLAYHEFEEGLHKNNFQLNRKVLSELAVYEPATFEALAKLGEKQNPEQDK